MVRSIFILFCFSLKLILAENLNETNFLYQLQNTEVKIYQNQSKENITSLISSEDELKKEIIKIVEFIKGFSGDSRFLFDFLKLLIKSNLNIFFEQYNMTFLYNLTEDIFGEKSTFLNDLFDVLVNHTELIDYAIILVKGEIKGKNITEEQILKIICNITNIDGMDKVFGHIINSTHNFGIFKVIEAKFLNENYTTLYEYFRPILTKYKDSIIRFLYQILKAYNDKNAFIGVIKNFFVENRNNELMRDLREKFKEEKVRKEFSSKIKFSNDIADIMKEELLKSPKIIDSFFDLMNNSKIVEVFAGIIANRNNSTYIENSIPRMFKILYDEDRAQFRFLSDMTKKILKRVLSTHSTSLYFAEKIIEHLFRLYFKEKHKEYVINRECAS